jgi:hypothetical protein
MAPHRPQLKAGIIGDDHFGPVHHVKGDAIARPDAARGHSARQAFGLDRKPFISPHFFVKNKRRALRSSLRLVHQSACWSYFHLAGLPLLIGRAKLDRLRYRAISVSGKRLRL